MKEKFSYWENRLVLLIVFFLAISFSGNGQDRCREIIVSNSDSIVKSKILVEDEKINTNSDKQYFWYSNHVLRTNRGSYSGNLLHGTYEVFTREYVLIYKGVLKEGVRDGIWKRWFPDGELMIEENWKNGLKHGEFKFYNKQNEVFKIEKFKKGKLYDEILLTDLGIPKIESQSSLVIEYPVPENKIQDNSKPKFLRKNWESLKSFFKNHHLKREKETDEEIRNDIEEED